MGKKTKETSVKKAKVTRVTESENDYNVNKKLNYKIKINPRNEKQADYLRLLEEKEVVFCTGEAGCGKTHLAVSWALKTLKECDDIKKIYLLTTAVESEEKLGFLPGDVDDKLKPSMESFLFLFRKIVGDEIVEKMLKNKVIEFLPIGYLRGRNLENCIVLGDELQNLNIRGMKTLLTRISEHCKVCVMGDIKQIDNKTLQGRIENSGLYYITETVKKKPNQKIGVLEFNREDIVRNPIVDVFLGYFDK